MSARTLTHIDLPHIAAQSRFCVKAFARLVGVEVRTLERRFAQEFGCTPDEWLAEQRMSEAAALLQRGFWVSAIRYPTVPAGTERLRVTLSAAHSEAQVDGLLDALAESLPPRTMASSPTPAVHGASGS